MRRSGGGESTCMDTSMVEKGVDRGKKREFELCFQAMKTGC